MYDSPAIVTHCGVRNPWRDHFRIYLPKHGRNRFVRQRLNALVGLRPSWLRGILPFCDSYRQRDLSGTRISFRLTSRIKVRVLSVATQCGITPKRSVEAPSFQPFAGSTDSRTAALTQPSSRSALGHGWDAWMKGKCAYSVPFATLIQCYGEKDLGPLRLATGGPSVRDTRCSKVGSSRTRGE
jgi:hypothetical protein